MDLVVRLFFWVLYSIGKSIAVLFKRGCLDLKAYKCALL